MSAHPTAAMSSAAPRASLLKVFASRAAVMCGLSVAVLSSGLPVVGVCQDQTARLMRGVVTSLVPAWGTPSASEAVPGPLTKLVITRDCSGFNEAVFLTALLLAVPTPIRRRLRFVLEVLLWCLAFNVLRLLTLHLLLRSTSIGLWICHDVLFPFLLGAAGGVFLYVRVLPCVLRQPRSLVDA